MEITIPYIRKKFEEFNQQMFAGKLPMLPIKLSNAKTFLGMCCFKTRKCQNGKAEHYDFTLRMNTRIDLTEEEIEDTIIHEMIHYYILYFKLPDTGPHGKLFQEIMNGINQKYGRHLAISHKSTKAQREQAVDTRKRYHVIAVEMLKQLEDFDHFSEMADVVGRLQDKLSITTSNRKPIIHFDSVPNLKGLKLLNPLYNHIASKQTLRIMYQSFNAKEPTEYILYPYLLKEYRNRWFLFGCKAKDMLLYNLALDRIVSFEPIDLPFKQNPEFDGEHFFDDVIGVSKNLHNTPRTIKFWASAEQSKYIKTKPLHTSQKLVKENEDGSCVFKIDIVINFEMYSVFMSYGPGVRILSPRQAVSYMRDKIKEMASLYEQDFSNHNETKNNRL